MARTGIARLRHFKHRAHGRMRRQKVAPRYLADQSVRLSSAGNGPTPIPITGVDTTENNLIIEGHTLVTGDGPYEVKSTETLPGGLVAGQEYYIQVADATKVALVTDKRNAKHATKVNLTSVGTGSISINRHVADAPAVLSWHDERRAERVSTVDDIDSL